jgi:beta-lactamase class A
MKILIKQTLSKMFPNRLSVLIVALLLIIIIFLIVFGERATSVSGGRSDYLNPSLRILDKRNLIVDFQELREKLQRYETRGDYTVSVYFEYLPTGANIAVHKDEKIWPASLIKIPVAMAALKKVEEGKWKLDNELVILDQDKDSEFGDMYKLPTGTSMTIRKFLEESLVSSDNTAHFVLLRNLEGEELEDVFVHLGMDEVIDSLKRDNKKESDVDNRITAKRYSVFFRSLYNSTYFTHENSEMFLEILSGAPNEYLSVGLPNDIPFVHKTGIRIDERVMADSGIVYVPGRPYVLTVMIAQNKEGALDQEEIKKMFEDISREVYYYVSYAG